MGSRRVVIEDLLRFRAVSDLRLSSDGRRAAFVVAEQDPKADATRSNIWLLDEDGSLRQLTFGGTDPAPRWSPDQSQLAFLSSRRADGDKQPHVYVLRLAGGEARPLTAGLKGAAGLEWSPRGDRLAVVAWKATPQSGIGDLLNALHWDGAAEERRRKGDPLGDAPAREPGELASEDQAASGLRISGRLKYRFDGIGYFDGRRPICSWWRPTRRRRSSRPPQPRVSGTSRRSAGIPAESASPF